MFSFLKKLAFWKKKRQEEKATEQPSQPAESVQSAEPQVVPVKSVAQPPAAKPGEPIKEEKACPKCGAPNDKFVHVCWLCKGEI